MKHLTKNDWRNIAGLALLLTAFLVAYTRFQYCFGSVVDWNTQHWVLPQYFRLLFYDTGQLFPNFAFHLGGGQNIYYLAYYGLFSPLIFLSYLLPFLSLKNYVILLSILLLYVDIVLFYAWSRKRLDGRISFFITFLFLFSVPLIYHSHRHIMFVSYMPFLLLGLFAVDAWVEKKKRLPLLACAFLMVMTSFYFAVGGFLALFLYAGYVRLGDSRKGFFKCMIGVAGALGVSGLMSGILTIPTLYTLLSGRNASHGGPSWTGLLPRLEISNLMYNSHSAGLTAICFCAMLLGVFLGKKQERLLAGGLCAVTFVPALIFLMNGMMYCDAKVLIPFGPLVLLLTGLVTGRVLDQKLPLKKSMLILSVAGALAVPSVLLGKSFSYLNSRLPFAICGVFLLEMVMQFVVVRLYQKYKHAFLVFVPAMAATLCFCIFFNMCDELVPLDKMQIPETKAVSALAETALAQDDSFFRIGNFVESPDTVNMVYGPEYYRATIYSSTHNQNFSDFYFNGVYSEVAHRNAALTTQSRNYLFNIFMGNRYLIDKLPQTGSHDTLMTSVEQYGLYRNDEAFPVGYVSARQMRRDEYETLEYPYNIEALLRYAIVEDAPDSDFVSQMAPLSLGASSDSAVPLENALGGGTLSVSLKQETSCTVKLSEPISDKLLLIHCNADNRGAMQDIYVEINGVRNKLTDETWRYPNNNFTFDYVLEVPATLDTLTLNFSAGSYRLSDLTLYTLPLSLVTERQHELMPYAIDRNLTSGDVISGTVNAKEAGCFVLSVPYDEGFSATVDGVAVPCSRVSRDFIGFPLEAGSHRVVFTYRAPWRNFGTAASLVGFAGFGLIALNAWVRKRKSREALKSAEK